MNEIDAVQDCDVVKKFHFSWVRVCQAQAGRTKYVLDFQHRCFPHSHYVSAVLVEAETRAFYSSDIAIRSRIRISFGVGCCIGELSWRGGLGLSVLSARFR